MPQFSQFGRPKQVAMTTPALTIGDIMSLENNFDPELHEHFTGRFPRYTIGNDDTRVRFKTTDIAALGLVKGMKCAAVACQFEGTATAIDATGAITKATGTIGFTISDMEVLSALKIEKGEQDGAPGEIEVELRACVNEGTGADPTITFDVSLTI